jgi:hypothetical protein
MTEQEEKRAGEILNSLAGSCLFGLFFRWREESQYEDFAEYEKMVKEDAEKLGVTFVRMTQRPFGPVIRLADDVTIHCYVNTTHECWKRLREVAPTSAPKKKVPSAPVKTMTICHVPKVLDAEDNFKVQEGYEDLAALKVSAKKFWSYAEVARAMKVGQKVMVEVREKCGAFPNGILLGFGEVERTEEGYIRPRHLMQEF